MSKKKLIEEIENAAPASYSVVIFPSTGKTVRAILKGGNPKQRREWTESALKKIKSGKYIGDGWFELKTEKKKTQKPIKSNRIASTPKTKDNGTGSMD
ncbi:MAG: hypothetical protein GWN62_16815 [Aliifodinibius sp.]|nr:hypothetical protein [Fodinibius sp.]